MPIVIEDIKLYTVKELSELTGVTNITLRSYIINGKIKGRKMGGRYFVTADALKQFFSETEQKRKKWCFLFVLIYCMESV